MNAPTTTSTTSPAGLTFPLVLSFVPADKLNVPDSADVLRVSTKAAKKGEKAAFPAYAAILPTVAESDPILRAALRAGLFYTLREYFAPADAKKPFVNAAYSGATVALELGEVEFCKLIDDGLSAERAAGKKLTKDEIVSTFRALRAGFERLVLDRTNASSVDALPDAQRLRMQADMMKIETALTQYASTTYRPGTPDEADKHIRYLSAIGSAAARINVDAGECWQQIQGRITAYLESVAGIEEDDADTFSF